MGMCGYHDPLPNLLEIPRQSRTLVSAALVALSRPEGLGGGVGASGGRVGLGAHPCLKSRNANAQPVSTARIVRWT